jgi:single-stranded DNA-specific DHH superfamily exonuclease
LFLKPSIENEHNPELLDHVKEGWELLQKHISKGSHLYIPIDPDVDGYTSASLVWNYLMDL